MTTHPVPNEDEAQDAIAVERERNFDRFAREWVEVAHDDPDRRTDITGGMLLRIIRLERAAARAEVIREVEALQARVKVLEDGLYRAKARAERHMKGPDAYYGIAMECEKALRALSQGGE